MAKSHSAGVYSSVCGVERGGGANKAIVGQNIVAGLGGLPG